MALENFILPKRVENPESLSDTHGEFHVQPLERGFGLTLGNALRRVLLSLEGTAVGCPHRRRPARVLHDPWRGRGWLRSP